MLTYSKETSVRHRFRGVESLGVSLEPFIMSTYSQLYPNSGTSGMIRSFGFNL